MRKVTILLVACFITLSLFIGVFMLPGSKEYDFRLHQQVSASGIFRLVFPEPMDHHSVEQHLIAPEKFSYVHGWEGESLVLTPTSPLVVGETYSIRLDRAALKADGLPLGRDLDYTFEVTGAPALVASVPTGSASAVLPSTDIVLVFDRPIVPLSQVQGGVSTLLKKSWPVTIRPSVRGSWKWLGTTTAAFVLDAPLQRATRYSISVLPGITTVSGDTTERDYSFSFETERPRLLSSSPVRDSRASGPTTPLQLSFNQEMDLVTARNFITLERLASDTSSQGQDEIGNVMPIRTFAYGTDTIEGKVVTDKTTLVIVPEKPLLFSSQYRLRVKQGLRSIEGNLGTENEEVIHFATVGAFSVTKAEYDARVGVLSFDMTSPIEAEIAAKNIVFSPPVTLESSSISSYRSYEGESEHVQIFAPFNPSTSYTVSFGPSMSDVFGQKLSKDFSYSFTTAPITPEVFLYPRYTDFGIFEKSKSPLFYVNHVNVDSLQISLGSVSLEKFMAQRKSRNVGSYSAREDISDYVETSEQWTVKSDAKLDAWDSTPLDLSKKIAGLPSGLYAIAMRAKGWNDYQGQPNVDLRIFAVTNLGITVKYSGQQALVWVTDLQTGEPVKNAKVKFHALGGSVPLSGVTDESGLFRGRLPIDEFSVREYEYQPEFWVTAEKDGDLAFAGSDWNSGVRIEDFGSSMYSEFRTPNSPAYRAQYQLYTERPMYAAGDTVHMKGIVRLLDWNGTLSSPDAATRSVALTIQDAEGKEVLNTTVKLSPFGTFTTDFVLANEASLGSYSIRGKVLPDSDISGELWGSFSVLAYRKPEYKLSLTSDKEEYAAGEPAKLSLLGQYYFGSPMSGSPVAWRASTTDYFFNKYTEEWYSFGTDETWCWDQCERSQAEFTTGKGTLSDEGEFSFDVSTNIDAKSVSQVMSVETDVTDPNNQVVSGRTDFVIHKSNVYVGLRSDSYGAARGEKVSVSAITLDPDGSPAKNQRIDISVYSRTWNVVKEKGVDGGYYYNSTPEDTFLYSSRASSDADGKATITVSLPVAGEYRVVATVRDAQGRKAEAGWSLYAWSDAYVNWPRTNNDRMEIVLDKPEYNVGDTAKLLLKSPYRGKGVKALVTVERENVMTVRVLDIKENAETIDIPVTEDLLPVAYVSVVIMKPRIGETFDDEGVDTGAPAFKVGYAKLLVDTAPRELTVVITTDKEKYVPGDTVQATITASDAAGNPVQAEFSLGVVDLSLLDLTGFSLPDLVATFYYRRGLGVVTSNMLSFLVERFKPGSKGGGGGEERKRGNFLDTAYWNPLVVTKKDGKATVSFALPDNLTTWQLLAIGSTKNHFFGQAAKTIVETKRVIIRPVRPRFAVEQDKVTLGAIVHNELDEDRSFVVSLSGSGFTALGEESQTVFVKKNTQVKLSFPVRFAVGNSATLRFTATTEGASDDIEETIPVYKFGILQTIATSGVVDTQTEESIAVPTKKDATEGNLTVSLAPSLGVHLPGSLEYLATFPYGCAEQTMSAILPNLALLQLQSFDSFAVVDDSTLRNQVSVALQKIYALQRSDGGFGYFQGSDQSYPYLTAYILEGLKIAERAGMSFDQSVVQSALSYVEKSSGGSRGTIDNASRAYIVYILSLYGSSVSSELRSLYSLRQDLPLYAKAHLTMALQNTGETAKAKKLTDELLTTVRISARGAHFEESSRSWYASMNTNARTTALVLRAILATDPSNPLVPKIIRGMLASRQNGHWDTTQSTAQSILSFVQYMKQTDELNFDFSAGVELSGKNILSHRFVAPMLEVQQVSKALSELRSGETETLKIGKQGKGNLYYDAALTYFYTPDTLEPAEEGIGILRETTPLTKADAALKVGSTHKVRLTITVPKTRHFVAVESMLAAGFEPIDVNFATSQQNLLTQSINQDDTAHSWYDGGNQLWRFSHIEIRDDRIFLFADELPPGVYTYEYLQRATTPGTFRERPAKVWEMYFPETFGQTDGGWVTIGE